MSGGHWDYGAFRIQNATSAMANDPIVKRRWKILGDLCGELGNRLGEIEHLMDWDISGDTMIDDDARFESFMIGKLLEACMKAAPDEWFPRGKWATIQAIQERTAGNDGNNEIERRIYKRDASGSQEHEQYLAARFGDGKSGLESFDLDGHRWKYKHTSFDDAGDYDLIFRYPTAGNEAEK